MVAPVAGDTLAMLRDHIWQTDLTFELLEEFQALAAISEWNVYPWEGLLSILMNW